MKKTKILLLIPIFALAGCKELPKYNDDSYSYIPVDSMESEEKEEITFDFSTSEDFASIYSKIENGENINFTDLNEKIFVSDYKYSKINEKITSAELYYDVVGAGIIHVDGAYNLIDTVSVIRDNQTYSLTKNHVEEKTTFEVNSGVETEVNKIDNFIETTTLDKENEIVNYSLVSQNDSTRNIEKESDFIYSTYYQNLNLINSNEIYMEFVSSYELLSNREFDEGDITNNIFNHNESITDEVAKIEYYFQKTITGFQGKDTIVRIEFELQFTSTDLIDIYYKYVEADYGDVNFVNPRIVNSIYKQVVNS